MNQSTHQSLPQLKIGKGDNPTFDYIPNFSTASKSEVLVSYELTDADDEEDTSPSTAATAAAAAAIVADMSSMSSGNLEHA